MGMTRGIVEIEFGDDWKRCIMLFNSLVKSVYSEGKKEGLEEELWKVRPKYYEHNGCVWKDVTGAL